MSDEIKTFADFKALLAWEEKEVSKENNIKKTKPWEAEPRELIARSLNKIPMRAIDWLWRGWVPRGYITIWAGESGAGKSTVLADVAAKVTTGAPWPGETDHRNPGWVVWLGSEDGIEELTIPRLTACGADLSKVVEIQGVMQSGQRGSFSLQDDIASVKKFLSEAKDFGAPISLLVIDPVTSYLAGQRLKKVDLNDAGQLRSVLEPWLAIAQEHNIAIVCVTHFMKDTTRAMLHRVLGSAAFTQTCRSLCAVVARPEAGTYAKTLMQVKINLPEHPGGAWLFSTEKILVGNDNILSKPIYATRPLWEQLDPSVTPDGVVGASARGPVSQYPMVFGVWIKAHFMNVPQGQGLKVSEVKAAAIAAKVASARWWDDHSGEFLEKQNFSGVWWCRPKV